MATQAWTMPYDTSRDGQGAVDWQAACFFAAFVSLAVVATTLAQTPSSYPEAQRFNTAQFHDGLKKRGLTDLLALHLLEHPPGDPLDAALLARDVKLAESADPSRTIEQRRASLAQANELLGQLIDEYPDHKSVQAWRMELANSILYEQAEPYTSAFLFRAINTEQRAELRRLMAHAVEILEGLHADLSARYDALDDMPAREYDVLEGRGEVDRLESDLARSDYMLAWSRFYLAAASGPGDPETAGRLGEVVDYLENRSNLLSIPHAETHFQAQAQLLAGMSFRELGRQVNARSHLQRAADTVDNVLDDRERRDLAWVALAARVELARSFCDVREFEAAVRAVDALRTYVAQQAPGDFSLALVVALLDRTVHRAAADAAAATGMNAEADRLGDRALRDLRTLAQAEPTHRDEIYAVLYDTLGEQRDLPTLQPLERCAIVAGLLGDAADVQGKIAGLLNDGVSSDDPRVQQIEQQRAELLDRAIAVADPMTAPGYAIAPDLRAEAVFNRAVAQQQRGLRFEAVRGFVQVAREHPQFARSPDAVTFAVRVAWEMMQDPALAAQPGVQQLNLDALTTLTENYADSDAGRYWQFFLGQQLGELRRYDEAAAAFGGVDEHHERYFESRFLMAEALAQSVNDWASSGPKDTAEINRRADDALRAARDAQRLLHDAAGAEKDSKRRAALQHLAARATLLVAELYALRGVDRWDKALDSLSDFETRHPDDPALIGRVLRTRMIALDGLGRHDEAAALIPTYMQSDPSGAAATLQSLFEILNGEIERDRLAGRDQQARDRARAAFRIAEGLYALGADQSDLFGPQARYALRLQLAESALQTGDYPRAGDLFRQCCREDAERHEDGQPRDTRAIRGAAEALFQLRRFDEALPLFNRLFQSLPRGQRPWWEALLRDLQCRTELGQEAKPIIKSIQQQKFFDERMGGSDLRRDFDALLTANERRLESEPRPSQSEPRP